MEIIEHILTIVTLIAAIIALVGKTTKWGQKLLGKRIRESTQNLTVTNCQQSQDIQEIKAAIAQMQKQLALIPSIQEWAAQSCRNTIETIYEKYRESQVIPYYEWETVNKTYEIYHTCFHGNSYATHLYEQIMDWRKDGIPQDVSQKLKEAYHDTLNTRW